MIVYCPKCKSEYNAGAEYFGKSFRCGCGEIVFVKAPSTPQNTSTPKPKPPVSPTQTQGQAVNSAETAKATVKPEAKKVAEASQTTAQKESREKEKGDSGEKKEKKPNAETASPESEKKPRKTFYEILIRGVCVTGILAEIANFLVCFEIAGGLAEQVPVSLNALPILVFIAIWSVSSVFVFLFFAALAALFRLADLACRSAGIRPFLF